MIVREGMRTAYGAIDAYGAAFLVLDEAHGLMLPLV